MAKINLLTIHYGKCYGAVMQTYATCRLLEEAGHDVTVINIVHPRLKNHYISFRKLASIITEWQFYLFKKRYFSKMTSKTYSIDDQKLPDADYTIVGSDQVWTRDITGDFGNAFFLDFVPENQKRIAFCSSFGKSMWEESAGYTNSVRKELENFSAISVREKSGQNILNEIFGIHGICLQDPTIGYGEFDRLILNDKSQNCIFPFLLNLSSEAKKKAQLLAKELSCPLYFPNRLKACLFRGPRRWLTNIHNSKYVITDSFHGLALSIIFHKNFFVFCADSKKFTRLLSLLELVGLENRYIKSEEDFLNRKNELLIPIDYKTVDNILRQKKDEFRQFIRDSVK